MAQEDGIIAKKAPPRELIPAGNHIARCISMILIGTVEEDFKGAKSKQMKVRIGWELPTELRVFKEGDEPRPCTISAEYTLSTGPKANLRKVLDSWRGKALSEKEASAFDITVLIGKSCLLNIIHKPGKGENSDKVYENISAVASLPKGMPVPDQINDSVVFNYGNKFSVAFVESLPDFIKSKIKSSDEWQMKVQEGIVAKQTEAEKQEEDSAPQDPGQIDDLPF